MIIIITILLLITYFLTIIGLSKIISSSGPILREQAFRYLVIGFITRIIIICIACYKGLPILYGILAQLLPIILMILASLYETIKDYLGAKIHKTKL